MPKSMKMCTKKRNSTNTRGSKSSNISLHDETVFKDSIHDSPEKVKEKFSDRQETTSAEELYDLMGENEKLKKRVQIITDDIERWKERLKMEGKVTKPIFNQKDVLGILNDELERYPSVKADQDYATRKVAEKFLSGEMKVDESTTNAIKATVDNVAKVNILESGKELKKQNSDRLTENDLQAYLKAGTRANISKQKALSQGKKIILTSEDEITSFIHDSIEGVKSLNTVGYGRVNERLSNDVEEYSDGDIKIDGNFLELVPDDINHAYKEHLIAKEEGDIDLSINDFENIPSYIDFYDELVYAIRFGSGNTRICLSKKLPNGRVLIIETVSKSRGSIEFKNMIGVSEEKYAEKYENVYKKKKQYEYQREQKLQYLSA